MHLTRTTAVLALALALAATLASVRPAAAVTFYDGIVDASPTAHGLTYAPFPFTTFYTSAGGVTTLDTSVNNSYYAGFGENSIPLDRATGYTVGFDVGIDVSTGSANRTGFNVLAISSDLKGVELGFKGDTIFVQDASFTGFANSASFNTSGLRHYNLTVLGNTYTLSTPGFPTLLTSSLIDYSAYPVPFPLPNPYATPNSLFFGDDTTSAGGRTLITSLSLTVPEPTTLGALWMIALITRRRR